MNNEAIIAIIIALVVFIVGGTAWWIDTLRFEIKQLKQRLDFIEKHFWEKP